MAQEVRAVVWQSEGCRFDPTPGRVEVSLSKTPNPQLAPDVLGWYLAWQPIAVGVWMVEWEA